MNNYMNKVMLKGIEKVARKEVEKMEKSWPPLCIGLLHQPKRPQKRK